MAWLSTDNYVEPNRVEPTGMLGPRFWVDGKPECGAFTMSELIAAYGDINAVRSAIWEGHIVVDATRRCECGKAA